jgi:hypothetical protein
MVFTPKIVDNSLAFELNLLSQELTEFKDRGYFKEDRITLSTILVYSALKSGITDEDVISEHFFLTINAVRRELNALYIIRMRVQKLYKNKKSVPRLPGVITVDELDDYEIAPVTERPVSDLVMRARQRAADKEKQKDEGPMDLKSRLKKLQLK